MAKSTNSDTQVVSKDQIGVTAIKDAKKLGIPRMLLLGLQHLFAMFGATITVPILTGLSVQVTLFCAGMGTLVFHLCSKFKVPAFLGSSFAFLGGFAAVKALDSGEFANLTEAQKLPYACGGIVVAGALYFILALIIKLIGVKKVMKYIPPVVTGPIIICIGLGLAPSAVSNASTNWLLAVIAIVCVVIFNIWGKGMFKITSILMAVIISYIAAIIMEITGYADTLSLQSFKDAAIIGIPDFQLAKFSISAILAMAPIAIASMMEHIGDISAISATTEENFIEDPGLHRTLMGDGLATMLAGFIGGPANTTYGENTGVLELSKVHDPRVVRLAAVYAIILSFIPKFSNLIEQMPAAIVGGISFVLYGMISAIGVRNVMENHVDFTKSRNLIIAALILVCGLGFSDGITFTVAGTSITLTGLAIAAIVGIFMNAILPGNDYEYGVDTKGDENRGVHIK
jgi:uracil permease